jgi:DUF438 domain-containing protein
MWYIPTYNGLLSSHKENEILSFTAKWIETGKPNAMWSKPDTERQVLHVLSHIWKLKWKVTWKQNSDY